MKTSQYNNNIVELTVDEKKAVNGGGFICLLGLAVVAAYIFITRNQSTPSVLPPDGPTPNPLSGITPFRKWNF